MLAAEAPIHLDLLARRVAAYFGVGRVTPRIVEQIRSVLEGRARVGDEHDVVWRADQDPATVPSVRVAGTNAVACRDITEIPLSEVAAAARIVVERATGLGETELVRDCARLLGFARITGSRDRSRVTRRPARRDARADRDRERPRTSAELDGAELDLARPDPLGLVGPVGRAQVLPQAGREAEAVRDVEHREDRPTRSGSRSCRRVRPTRTASAPVASAYAANAAGASGHSGGTASSATPPVTMKNGSAGRIFVNRPSLSSVRARPRPYLKYCFASVRNESRG